MPETTTTACSACGRWQAIGSPTERREQFRDHWLSCYGVAAITFHPDGTLASVTFR